MTANLNENPSSCECQSDSIIQGASGETEKRRRKTNRSGRNQRMGGGKNTKQKKNKKSGQVSSTMKGVYSGAEYMGKERNLRKHKRSIKRV